MRSIRREGGWAVVTAMIVISLMMALGVASFAYVDGQTRKSGEERIQESSFNLTEGAVQQQGYILGANWPGNSSAVYPTVCNQDNALTQCPAPANLANAAGTGSFSHADYKTGVTWETRVRDNGSPASDFYTSSVLDQPAWDANQDDKLWVHATATVRGETRTLVALLKRERLVEPFPKNTITAGWFQTSNDGNKVIVDTTGSQVVVRCTTPSPGTTGDACLGYDSDKSKGGQLSPPGAYELNPSTPPAMTLDQINRFRDVAKTSNPPKYFTTCPSSLTGSVVFIELPSTEDECNYTANNVYNTSAKPGLVLMTRGRLEFKEVLYGLIYHANVENQTGWCVKVHGNGDVQGGVSVDGGCGVVGGSSKQNVTFRSNAFNTLQTFGTAGLIQNTWRELPPGG